MILPINLKSDLVYRVVIILSASFHSPMTEPRWRAGCTDNIVCELLELLRQLIVLHGDPVYVYMYICK